jgi:hypothetical protein
MTMVAARRAGEQIDSGRKRGRPGLDWYFPEAAGGYDARQAPELDTRLSSLPQTKFDGGLHALEQ